MPSLLLGFRNILLPGLAVAACLFAFQYYHGVWQPWVEVINQLPYWLLTVSFLLALQFNRSRLSIISLLLFLFYAVQQQVLPGIEFLNQYRELIYLSGVLVGTSFLFIYDRALISFHGVLRLLLLVACFLVACAWLWAAQLWFKPVLLQWLPQHAVFSEIITIEVVSILLMVVCLVKSVSSPSTVVSVLFVVTSLWVANFYYVSLMLLPVLMVVIGVMLVLAVLLDSYLLAYRDELTGLPSRRALQQLVLSLGRNYCVVMVDVDHFKKVNDNYGHDIGDQVLKLVAAKLKKVKAGGKVFRYGGEEFTIIFPRKSAGDVLINLESIRQNIEDYKMIVREDIREQKDKTHRKDVSTTKESTVSVTVSMGVSEKSAGVEFEVVLKSADKMLYQAKEQGRNQVVFS